MSPAPSRPPQARAAPPLSVPERLAVAVTVSSAVKGGRASRDERFRSPGDTPDDTPFVSRLAAEAAVHLEGKPADRILAWAADVLPRFAVTSSFGAESVVLLHLLSKLGRKVPVVFLDTGYHFPETIAYRRQLAERFDLQVIDVHPELSVPEQDARHGAELFRRDPDACCGMRKTIPLRHALADVDGWATGVRRVQTPERAATPVVEARRLGGRWLTKVAPLAAWTDDDVQDYRSTHDLPAHPLEASGFRSIGCAPCTRPSVGADPRSGRWAGTGKTECGLHLPADGPAVRLRTTPG